MSDKKRKRKIIEEIIRLTREFDSLEPTEKEWERLADGVEDVLGPSKDSSEEEE